MSYRLLVETINYRENKDNYTREERLVIEADLERRTNSLLKSLGNIATDAIDRINDC